MPIYAVWSGASGCTGRTHASRSAATAITADERRWTGASRTASTISSVCPPTRSWPLRVFIKTDDAFASDARPPIWMSCAIITETLLSRQILVASPPQVVARIEATRKGLDTPLCRHRHHLRAPPRGSMTASYCARGQAENLIKRHKSQLASDRTSCRLPLANQMRLILHSSSSWLLLSVRDVFPCMQPLASGEFSTIRLRLLKIAVRIKETASRDQAGVFAANCPEAALFRGLIGALIPRPT